MNTMEKKDGTIEFDSIMKILKDKSYKQAKLLLEALMRQIELRAIIK